MIPVPNHLPKSFNSQPALNGSNGTMEVDSVLDLVEPLFKAGNAGLSVRQVQEVREQLQLSISTNKV